ncbi:sugar kinase [Vibrio hepatarius]|uniref:sugar kinase n=1 Tax=Vibrio hepatarius TaxID=171383 RepID=UPI0034C6D70D
MTAIDKDLVWIMHDKKVAIIGECMVELRKTEDGIEKAFGGDTLNTALYISRLAKQNQRDFEVSYFTALGEDKLSDGMVSAWQSEGIDVSQVSRYADKLPGLYMIENRPCGERDFFYWRNDAAVRQWLSREDPEHLFQSLKHYDVIYLSGITLAILTATQSSLLIDLLKRLKDQGCLIAFDTNYRPNLWLTKAQAQQRFTQLYQLSDIALLTFEDEQLLFGDESTQATLERLREFNISQLVIKSGADGCLVVTDEAEQWVTTEKVPHVVDTTAAGDSFNAGYLYQWLVTRDCIKAARAGHTLAGTVIQHKGAVIDFQHMPLISN